MFHAVDPVGAAHVATSTLFSIPGIKSAFTSSGFDEETARKLATEVAAGQREVPENATPALIQKTKLPSWVIPLTILTLGVGFYLNRARFK